MEIGPVLDLPSEGLEELYARYMNLDLNQCINSYLEVLTRLQQELPNASEKNRQAIVQLTQIEEYLKNRIVEKAIIRYFEESEEGFADEAENVFVL